MERASIMTCFKGETLSTELKRKGEEGGCHHHSLVNP